ncbi:MAG: NAD(P)/FAD-dependent oxidoreductase [Clostridiales bacterium]|jgi:predicted Rossmann fold flavoprotein|nr:NAD(P)/FAD-dependent oxidoreductase [Clostridiales bacterium]
MFNEEADIIIIGAGPAGMMAGIAAKEAGAKSVLILDRNEKAGKKLYITGKGRCNVTNDCAEAEFLRNVVANPKFLYKALYSFPPAAALAFFKERGLALKTERGRRVFPVSDKSSDVTAALLRALNRAGAEVRLNRRVTQINAQSTVHSPQLKDSAQCTVHSPQLSGNAQCTMHNAQLNDNAQCGMQKAELNDKTSTVECKKNKTATVDCGLWTVDCKTDGGLRTTDCKAGAETFRARKLILACGGLSYPATGSTGDGYRFAAAFGHNIISPRPALAPILTRDAFVPKLEGLSLKNTGFRIVDARGKTLAEDFGELLFTNNGVSGPVALSASSRINRMDLAKEPLQISLDLKPALSPEQLDARILRDFGAGANRQFKNSLDELLPKSLIPVVIELSGIPEAKPLNQITKDERKGLAALLKDFRLTVSGVGPIGEGIVTAGGVDVKEVNPSTMESRLVPGLYFAGEMLDVDALTGGYNIHIALATGYLAGQRAGAKN